MKFNYRDFFGLITVTLILIYFIGTSYTASHEGVVWLVPEWLLLLCIIVSACKTMALHFRRR